MASVTAGTIGPQFELLERATIKQVTWRLMPVLMLGYFCAYLDRVNVGFAKLTMQNALGMTDAVFGFGAGVFFIGYFIAEIPSNLVLNRVGARKWIARILLTWGIISGLTAFVWNEWSFYIVRFVLGLAEAGFYPGIVLYLTWWFPSHYRSRMMGIFQSASVISLIIGPPVSAYLLSLDGWLGLQGWQLLFLIEALPPIIMCVATWLLLTDRPMDALWLRPEQRRWLQQRLDVERAQRESVHHFQLGEALSNPRVWLLTLVYFGQNVSGYGLLFFLPTIVKSFGVSTMTNGFISAIPFVFAAVAMIYWSLRSDRSGARILYVASACLLSGAGLIGCVFIGPSHPVWMMIVLILGIMGQFTIAPTFWPLPTAMLSGVAAAGGIALINAVGNLGGFLGPYMFGVIKDATGGSDLVALLAIGAAPVLSAIVLVALGHDQRLEGIPPQVAAAE
ncbi:MAG TPA: MFS transporter [Acetobacteraceae bacterium]|jgi:MFS family permease|nr:MFS transporter [Acetobacteraceae bacterium]